MTGLVLELQRDALNPEIKVSNLLRKAFVISKKLGISEIEDWLDKELNGYSPTDDIPAYRTVSGRVEVLNPYHGWQQVSFRNEQEFERFSKRAISQSVVELEVLSESNNKLFEIPFPPNIEKYLMDSIGFPLRPTLTTDKAKIIGVLEAIRKKILDWTLELQQQSILGEGMSFSVEEKTKAHQLTYQITNNIGSMHNSQLQQDSAHATQSLNVTETNQADLKKFVDELKAIADSLSLDQEQKQELNEHIAILESQSKSTKPNSVIIKESGRTIRNLIEGAMGSTISSGLVAYFHLFQ